MDSPELLARQPLFSTSALCAVPLAAADAPLLQRFLDDNPLYSQLVNGRPWLAGEALAEIVERPPFAHSAAHALAVLSPDEGRWLGFVSLCEDLIAPGVTHIGLFLLATAEHGSGLAPQLHGALEAWARGHAARVLRLGVVERNARAAAFWSRMGYQQTRLRWHDYPVGRLAVSVRVKPLGGTMAERIAEHLATVPRDRPESP